jgi:hypothetical protein
MQWLNAELLLLQGAIEQVRGRFELLLTEISDLQLEHGIDAPKCVGEIQRDHDAQSPVGEEATHLTQGNPDATTPRAIPSLLEPAEHQEVATGSITGQPSTPLDECGTPVLFKFDADDVERVDPIMPVGEGENASTLTGTIETLPPNQTYKAPEAIVATAEPQALSNDAECVTAAPKSQISAPFDVIMFDNHRQVTARTRTHQVHAVSSWAAVLALLAIMLDLAAWLSIDLRDHYAAAQQLGGMLRTMLF